MIKGLLKRRGDAEEVDPREGGDGFDITTARLPGRAIIAFQKRGGQATALEVTEQGAEILKGLAAGAVVSELEEVEAEHRLDVLPTLTTDTGASREEAEAFILSLDLLDGSEKRALMGALPR